MVSIPLVPPVSSGASYRPVELTSRLALKIAISPLQRWRWARLIAIFVPKPHLAAKVGIILGEKAGGGKCWPSIAAMAKEIGCSPREVSRATRALEEAKMIQRTQRFNASTLYLLTFPPTPSGMTPDDTTP